MAYQFPGPCCASEMAVIAAQAMEKTYLGNGMDSPREGELRRSEQFFMCSAVPTLRCGDVPRLWSSILAMLETVGR